MWKCVWGVGKCVWDDVGRGMERVLGLGQCGGCGEVWGEMWDNLGEGEIWEKGWCHDLGPQLS